VRPQFFDPTVPRVLGPPRFWTYVSGVAEIACGALVLNKNTRKVGAELSAALFVAVFPANLQAAFDGGIAAAKPPFNGPATAWARLPLQAPLILWARRVAKRAAR
jgi:uncharacterized membrane protein